MLCSDISQRLQASFFRRLNSVVEPLVKAGVGSPGCLPAGLIVLETVGRKSGRTFNVPVMAAMIDDALLIGTVRGQSQWIKNLAAANEIRYWFQGEARTGAAQVFMAGDDGSTDAGELSPLLRNVAQALQAINKFGGGSFAVLRPQ